eukprot:scaffold1062_cov130-Cylindrotheca_fusiformis.AAC.32
MPSSIASTTSMNNPLSFNPTPREEWTLITQGAEARVWKVPGMEGNGSLICKERFSKAYRHPELDERLIKSRTRAEAKILEKCKKKSDIRVPELVRVEKSILYMEYIHGSTLKDHLLEATKATNAKLSEENFLESLARDLGKLIAQLHNLGVIHGDLTTSNILVEGQELVLIDFGLAKSTSSVEEQAVDLYVLERALQSTHPELPDSFFAGLLNAYSEAAIASSSKKTQTTLQRLEQVRLRGRKRECFG